VKLPSRQLSVRVRLALIYNGLLIVALVAFGAGTFVVLRAQLIGSFDSALIANAEHAAGAFAQDVDAAGHLHPSSRLVEQLASTGGRVLVYEQRRTVIADSAPSGTTPPPLNFPDFAAADAHAHAVRSFVTAAGDTRRFTVHPITTTGGGQVGYVVWAESTRPLDALLWTVAAALVLGGLAVTGVALASGFLLARRALSPVADVTETARAIALSGDFAARVEAGQRGDEIGDLAVAFNEMLEALEQNHQALQRFLGDASHQLRTPLTTVRANLDLARRPDLPLEEREAILADARDEAERMGRLIGDLLSLARAESGARLEFNPVELDAVLVESVRRERKAAPHVRMAVGAVEPAIVDGEGDRLRELIEILLDNAARYTPSAGTVTASLEVHDRQVILRVEDTGIGLGQTDPARLFERLYRGPRARELRPAGTGLGLAIARWIVEAHGGTIRLANRDGGGTIAIVTLPVRRP
jgi:two-component system, OmpR family, sensor kinase